MPEKLFVITGPFPATFVKALTKENAQMRFLENIGVGHRDRIVAAMTISEVGNLNEFLALAPIEFSLADADF